MPIPNLICSWHCNTKISSPPHKNSVLQWNTFIFSNRSTFSFYCWL